MPYLRGSVLFSILWSAAVYFLAVSEASAVAPPRDGSFPPGFRQAESRDRTPFRGDPGWVRKMARRRETLGKAAIFPPAGDTFFVPVLLGRYSDVPGVHTRQQVQELLFGSNPTGSLTEYYREVSYGQFSITGAVHGWFTLENPQDYYTPENYLDRSDRECDLEGYVTDLLIAADDDVDFSLYDNDGPDGIPNSGDDDGYADTVICVCSGHDPSGNQTHANLWPSAGSLSSDYETMDEGMNGEYIKIHTFIVCAELEGNSDELSRIGVYAHEFGHILGLPDLYDRTDDSTPPDYNKSEGVGRWCLMAGGSWGGDGEHQETPVHMSAWCKVQMGWVNPVVITTPGFGLSIPRVEDNPVVYKLWEDEYAGSRYFLIENRQRTGFDRYLPGSGMMIYHVDENRGCGKFAWAWGTCNDDENLKLVDVEEADGRNDMDGPDKNRGDDGDPFPGATGNRAFTDFTIPNSRDFSGAATSVTVTNISDSGDLMTFDAAPRSTSGFILGYDENGMSGLGWGLGYPADYWGGVLFTAPEAGRLTGVDYGSNVDDTTYEITVFSSFDENTRRPSGILAQMEGYAPISGWYTATLPDSGIVLQSGQDFFVQVRSSGADYPMGFDYWGTDSGRSYYSGDGETFYGGHNPGFYYGDMNLRARIRSFPAGNVLVEDRPAGFRLHDPSPNPVNSSTVIRYELPEDTRVRLAVYDILGREIAVLEDGLRPAGSHETVWRGTDRDGRTVGSGVYLYRFRGGNSSHMGKIAFLK